MEILISSPPWDSSMQLGLEDPSVFCWWGSCQRDSVAIWAPGVH
jgi:hypothetical protein